MNICHVITLSSLYENFSQVRRLQTFSYPINTVVKDEKYVSYSIAKCIFIINDPYQFQIAEVSSSPWLFQQGTVSKTWYFSISAGAAHN